mmetsp:Transcript_7350/g.23538  ORF Transcript_7350/g.23538 Transcript_7350/m.23538 type:complete len:267 (-) Transcript_7350:166-966(-)
MDARALLAQASAQPANSDARIARHARRSERAVLGAVLEADRAEARVDDGGVDRLRARRAQAGVREGGHRLREGGRATRAVRRLGARLEVLGVDVEPLVGRCDVHADRHRAQVAVEHERLQEEDARELRALGAARERDGGRARHLHVARAGEDDVALHDVVRDHRKQRALGRRAERVLLVAVDVGRAALDERVRRLAPRVPLLDIAKLRSRALRRGERRRRLQHCVHNRAAVAKGAHAASSGFATRRERHRLGRHRARLARQRGSHV